MTGKKFDKERCVVNIVPFDSITLNTERIDWLLIDVEGFDYEVLQGTGETLKKTRNIIIEI
ncbi:MAG: FkbM family methyltransferase, partial [Thermoplasmata archaeon]